MFFAVRDLRRFAFALSGFGLVLAAVGALRAQTTAPILLPNTFSSVAGGGNGTATAANPYASGSACSTGSPYKATDVYGDGCPASQSVLGYDFFQGVEVDGQGNLWINDASNSWAGGALVNLLRRVDAKSGIITAPLSSAYTICSAATSGVLGHNDSVGDGCALGSALWSQERGIGSDPYGNILDAGYNGHYVRVICNAVSPLCPIAAGTAQSFSTAKKQVGYVYRLAGCSAAGSTATQISPTFTVSNFSITSDVITFTTSTQALAAGESVTLSTAVAPSVAYLTAGTAFTVLSATSTSFTAAINQANVSSTALTAGTFTVGAGGAGDGYFASSFWNLPGDVASWTGAVTGFTATPTAEPTGGTCGSGVGIMTTGEIDSPRAVTGDQYGNVYIHDANLRLRVIVGPFSYNGINNPLPAILQMSTGTSVNYSGVTAAQMYGRMYPILGGFATSATGKTCGTIAGTSAPLALDTYGDGCPWYNTTVSNASVIGDAIDSTTEGGTVAPNLVIADTGPSTVRVLYMGPTVAVGSITAAAYPMANAIYLNNPSLTSVTQGYVYLLAGGGATGISATPTLGKSTTGVTYARVSTGPNGNLFLAEGSGTGANIAFYDLSTGYIRELIKSGTATNAGTSWTEKPGTGTVASGGTTYCSASGGTGDGQAAVSTLGTLATNACFNFSGTGSETLGIAVDAQNNLYIGDSEVDSGGYSRSRIRKVLATALYPTNMGAGATTQTVYIHGAAGTTGSTTAITASTYNTPSDISVGTPVCAATRNGDTTEDCLAPVTFMPAAPGIRDATLALSDTSLSTSGTFPLLGLSTGSALVADPTLLGTPVTTNLIGTGATPYGAAVDSNGDVFTMDITSGKFDEIPAGGSVTQLTGTVPSSPTQISLDPSGNLWAAGTGNPTLTKLTLGSGGTYTSGTVTITGVAAPQAVASDLQGNLFVADQTTSSVYEVAAATISGTTIPSTSGSLPTYQPLATIATGLTTPTSLAIDGNGNVYIGDSGAGAIFRVDAVSGAKTTFASGIHPAAVAADTAGDVYYQDSVSKTIVEYPFGSISSGVAGATTVTVLSSLFTPTGLAVAGNGNLYSADIGTATPSLSLVARNALLYNFGTTTGTTFGAALTNVGNLAATGYAATNATEFPMTGSASGGCGTFPSTANPLAAGSSCTITSTFVPATTGGATTSSSNSLLASSSTTGTLVLKGVEPAGVTPTATVSLVNGPAGNTAAYLPSGNELSYTVDVTASDGSTVSGYVNVTIDSGAAVQYTLTSGTTATYTIQVSGLTAGTHSVSVLYPSGQADLQSNTATQSFSITQASVTTAWTPGTTSVQYSQPIGAAALNATAKYNGSTVPGVFVYSATPSGGSASEVNAATYLAINTYTLGATFYPTDSVDFASATVSGGTFTVTTASTTAAIGVTQNLVAADGTGNFTSVQTALETLSPTAGGNLYIKPGTYNGFVTVAIPNVSMYGLGGVPGNVILTNEDGAFSSPFLTGQGVGNNGSSGDQGSSTLVVARAAIAGYNGGATTTPYNFYGENFTVQNTYDTDNSNAQTNQYINGSCTTVSASNALSNLTLYNGAGTSVSPGLCNSQALAIWITGDQAVLNNIYANSLQDTIYAGSISASNGYAARQYWFRGKVTGDVDYIFGDAAAVFDHTTIYSAYHGTAASGTVTIEAQNKADQTGGGSDYLSGYIMNSDVFTSQGPNMTALYFGRPYGHYSTYVMLNSYVDQVASVGYIEFSGDTNLPTSTYVEYNDHTYADPTGTNPTDLNGVSYAGNGGNSGSGVTGTRETTSTNPGTIEAATGGYQTNYPTLTNTQLSPAEAQQYYPLAFLGTTVGTNPYNNGVTTWNPTTAIAAHVNAFVPSGTSASVVAGTSVTLLMRPQVPGQGAVNNGSGNPVTFTVPTGTYAVTDNGSPASWTLSGGATSGTLDASGSAYATSSSIPIGTHNLVFTFTSGDSNFSGSTSSTYTLTVNGVSTVTTLSVNTATPTYGSALSISATVSEVSGTGTPTGSVTLTVDGVALSPVTLSGGIATFAPTGLNAGSHTLSAVYSGDAINNTSTGTGSVTLAKVPLTVTATGFTRAFETANPALTANLSGFAGTDTASTSVTGTPALSTTALPNSPAGTYPVSVAQGTLSSTNYSFGTFTAGVATITVPSGGVAQSIIFPAIPTIPVGSTIPLFARSLSGLPVTYSVTGGSGTITGGNKLHITGAGTITVSASQSGNSTFAAATSVTRSFTAQ